MTGATGEGYGGGKPGERPGWGGSATSLMAVLGQGRQLILGH